MNFYRFTLLFYVDIGVADRLVLEDLPASTDLQDGDLIETSGLGGRFPPGYPVGTVASVEATQDSPYLQALLFF